MQRIVLYKTSEGKPRLLTCSVEDHEHTGSVFIFTPVQARKITKELWDELEYIEE